MLSDSSCVVGQQQFLESEHDSSCCHTVGLICRRYGLKHGKRDVKHGEMQFTSAVYGYILNRVFSR